MTGPIIPAEQWPEGAYMHTWDSNGLGNWHRPSYGAWHHWASDIPLPPGHDWRVPVMRQQSPAIDPDRILPPGHEHAAQDLRCQCCGYKTYHREHLGCIRAATPAIDLEQFREAVVVARTYYAEMAGDIHDPSHNDVAEADRLLALIDGQSVSEKPQKRRCPNNVAPGGCQLPNRFCTFPDCEKADKLLPPKGEGE